jgi:putative nucleotidyltransferase with HDIG domain
MEIISLARSIAERLLAEALPRRWSHVRAVAARAQRAAAALPPHDRPTLVAAAWLHDIGYASGLAKSGFHPLDGARWLRARDFDARVTSLVANHSCASFEAAERGLAAELAAEFPAELSATADALWYADLTTGPDGQRLDVLERLEEIRHRYGPDHLVTRFWGPAEPTAVAAVRRTEARLAVAAHAR